MFFSPRYTFISMSNLNSPVVVYVPSVLFDLLRPISGTCLIPDGCGNRVGSLWGHNLKTGGLDTFVCIDDKVRWIKTPLNNPVGILCLCRDKVLFLDDISLSVYLIVDLGCMSSDTIDCTN